MRFFVFLLLLSNLALGVEFDSYLKFNALRSDYVEINNLKKLKLSKEFAVSSWICFDEALAGQVIWELKGSRGSISLALNKADVGLVPMLEVSLGNEIIYGKINPSTGLKGWQFIAVVFNSSAKDGRLQLIVDGEDNELAYSFSKPDIKAQIPKDFSGINKLYFGADSLQKRCFNGKVGNLAIWLDARSIPFFKVLSHEPIDKENLNSYDKLGLYFSMDEACSMFLSELNTNHHGILQNTMNERNFINPRRVFYSSDILVNDENDPNYLLFNSQPDKLFKVSKNVRSPFEEYKHIDPDAEKKKAQRFKNEIIAALNDWHLKSLVVGLRSICYFNHGRFMVGESFEISLPSTKVKVLVDRVLKDPLRVILKVGDIEIVKLIDKK